MNGKASELYSWGPPKLKNELCLLQKKSRLVVAGCFFSKNSDQQIWKMTNFMAKSKTWWRISSNFNWWSKMYMTLSDYTQWMSWHKDEYLLLLSILSILMPVFCSLKCLNQSNKKIYIMPFNSIRSSSLYQTSEVTIFSLSKSSWREQKMTTIFTVWTQLQVLLRLQVKLNLKYIPVYENTKKLVGLHLR